MKALMSMVAFASSTPSKFEPATKLETVKTENLDNIDISKIKYEVAKKSEITRTENLGNVDMKKTEPTKVVTN